MKEYHEQWEVLRDVQVPEQVHKKLDSVLSTLPDPPRKKYHWMRWAASAAAILVFSFGVLAANPAIAVNIPIIGRLFAQVEKNVSFPGEYDTRAQAVPQNENSVQIDSGLTIKAAEIYCDGYSIFVTMEINAEEAIFDDLAEIITYYNRNENGEFVNEPGAVARYLHLEYDWKTDEMTERKAKKNNVIQGKVIDDHTFIGMLKLDIGPESETPVHQHQTVSLHINSFTYDTKHDTWNDSTQWDEGPSHCISGAWNFSLDFAVDTRAARVVSVNKQNQDGYGIEKVLVSPYQIVVYTIAPYTVLTEKDMATREEIIQKYGDRPYEEADLIAACEQDRKDRLGKRVYEYVEVAVFNDQGVAFEGEAMEDNILVFSVQDASTDQLHIFLATELFSIVRVPDIEAARNNAVFEAEIEVN